MSHSCFERLNPFSSLLFSLISHEFQGIMTYRDLRNFTEMMRSLGYQRLISFDSFRKPNFPLVAEILVWIIKRFDPESLMDADISSEGERVAFIRAAAEFLAVKARVKLNTKWLYQADNCAVKELLKPTLILYNAQRSNVDIVKPPTEKDASYTHAVQFEAKINDLKRAKDLSSKITTHGATLYQLLGLEPKLKELRIPGAMRSPDTSDAENAMREALKSMRAEITRVQDLTKEAEVTASSLEVKVERKKQDLERGRKRLDALKKVRPAFIEEFKKLEGELQSLFAEYLYRHRSMAYLYQQEQELAATEAEQLEQAKLATRKLIEQMQKDSQGWDPLSHDSVGNEEEDVSEGKGESKVVDRGALRGSSRKSRLGPTRGSSRSSKIAGSRNFGLTEEKIEDDGEEILDVEEDDRSESALETYSSELHLDGGGDISDLDSIEDDGLEEELISRSKSQQQHVKKGSSTNDDEF
ncbi:clusterin-associated protein 1 [Ischnura elegans]|uniref:clusterin-associated protein 1 n=1 Tax=Ischnura elegans TaxID=197161 RepID=UPI001ED8B6CD|nr:clusterin-associated protein 1 [Ischnura elegans]XP_046397542.1 clusterin-associated protein 1 [Ischnura elegans]